MISDSRKNAACQSCALFRHSCEGIATQYQDRYGIEELKPFGELVHA